MAEKCLIAATLAALVCHPSSTITCFKPKPSTKSPQKNEQKPKPKSKVLKSNEKLNPISGFSFTTSFSPGLVNMVSEVFEGNPLFGTIETVIRSGWLEKTCFKINKILRVNHTLSTLIKFEQYRQKVVIKSSKTTCRFNKKRLAVDGNELLQFHGATIYCSLGSNNGSSYLICKKKRCGVCRILDSKISIEDGSVSFFEKSWKAHEKLTECSSSNGVSSKKAIVVCRVIAGRIARCDKLGLIDGKEAGFDSLVGSTGARSNGDEELFVLNPRAVLPCFVVTYSV